MKKTLIIILGIIFSSQVLAIECGPYKIVAIQPQTDNVLVRVENESGTAVWKSIGLHSEPSTNSFQSILQQAFATGENVMLRFPNSQVCEQTEYSTSALMVRIYK